MQQTVELLSKRFGIELVPTFDSRPENCPDEVNGHFLQCEFNIGFSSLHLKEYPPMICIYDDGTAQFWHDATPYPVKANTRQEAAEMLRFLNPYPVKVDLITVDDFNQFIGAMREIALEYDEQ